MTLTGEVERYDDRLTDEWTRLKEIVCEELEEDSPDEVLEAAGRRILNDLSSRENVNLRIRSQVTAAFVTMGSYHMLANEYRPRVHWHPRFLERLESILLGGEP